MKTPSKVKNLVWRACRNSLPTKMNLVKQQVITDDRCDLCQSQQEDVHHALYLCPKLTELWQAIWNQRNNLYRGKQAATLRQLLQQAKECVQEFLALQEIPAPQ